MHRTSHLCHTARAGLDMSTNEFYLEGLRIVEEERASGAAQRATAEDRAVGNESERE